MKKLMTLMLGLALTMGCVTAFGQDTKDTTKSTKKAKAKSTKAPKKAKSTEKKS